MRERCLQQMLEHAIEYANRTAAAKRYGVATEPMLRWHWLAQIDGGDRRGATTEELAEIRDLKANVRRLEEDICMPIAPTTRRMPLQSRP